MRNRKDGKDSGGIKEGGARSEKGSFSDVPLRWALHGLINKWTSKTKDLFLNSFSTSCMYQLMIRISFQ